MRRRAVHLVIGRSKWRIGGVFGATQTYVVVITQFDKTSERCAATRGNERRPLLRKLILCWCWRVRSRLPGPSMHRSSRVVLAPLQAMSLDAPFHSPARRFVRPTGRVSNGSGHLECGHLSIAFVVSSTFSHTAESVRYPFQPTNVFQRTTVLETKLILPSYFHHIDLLDLPCCH